MYTIDSRHKKLAVSFSENSEKKVPKPGVVVMVVKFIEKA